MGKSTISMVIFNSYVSHYQRVAPRVCSPGAMGAPGEATALLAVSRSCIDFAEQEAFQAALQAELPNGRGVKNGENGRI